MLGNESDALGLFVKRVNRVMQVRDVISRIEAGAGLASHLEYVWNDRRRPCEGQGSVRSGAQWVPPSFDNPAISGARSRETP
jgi:hypothetical protein